MGFLRCQHYRRRCKIRAPCCNENLLSNPFDRHELVRQDVKQVICSVCDTEQPVAQVCSNCGVNMGEYFCKICNFFDDDTEKGQYHCHSCGICRVGGRENFFHCNKCGLATPFPCEVCGELYAASLPHLLRVPIRFVEGYDCDEMRSHECYHEMIKLHKYCCPICSKSVIDMSRTWKRIDEEIEATLMPEDYQYKKVWILCNDTTEVHFHIIGHKCSHCESDNRPAGTPSVRRSMSKNLSQ